MTLPSFAATMKASGLTPFPEQDLIAQYATDAKTSGSISLIEAPTGSGKTYNIAYHGLECAADGLTVIAVPTIELIFQTMAAIEKLKQTSRDLSRLKVCLVLGRSEFVSEMDLIAAFMDTDRLAIVERWIDDGAPGERKGDPLWTKHGLRHYLGRNGATTELPTGIDLQTSDKESEAAKIYLEQFEQEPDLVVASHAMVALDLMVRYHAAANWQRENAPTPRSLSIKERIDHESAARIEAAIENAGRLQDYRHLIVDEAHAFADNVRNVLAHGISMATLGHALSAAASKGLIARSLIQKFGEIRDRLQGLGAGGSERDRRVDWKAPSAETAIVNDLFGFLDAIKPSKLAKLKDEERFAIQRATRALREGRASRGALSTAISWSPVNRYPTITVGKSNIRSELDYFWAQLDSAVLISATIFTLDQAGEGATHIRRELSLPPNVVENRPIRGGWLYENVTLKLPTEERAISLKPEDISTASSREEWFDRQAAALVETLGGTVQRSLVLTTSLDATKRISEQLQAALPDHVVIAGNGKSLSEGKSLFLAIPAGRPVIWVAQGPAWVGLDLPDNMIDRLYIMKLPMTPPTANERGPRDFLRNRRRMHIQLKQGIGRLVRSRRPTPKTLWCFDPAFRDPKMAIWPIFEPYKAEFF